METLRPIRDSQTRSRAGRRAKPNADLDFAYPNAGAVDAVAIVDVFNAVAETNQGNNSRTLRVNVQTAPLRRARVTVTFTQITIHNDADPAADRGTMAGFQHQRANWALARFWDKSVDSGKTYAIDESFQVTLSEGEKLTICVNGTDEDNPGFPLFDDHDRMGEVRKEFVAPKVWPGSHRDKAPARTAAIRSTIALP